MRAASHRTIKEKIKTCRTQLSATMLLSACLFGIGTGLAFAAEEPSEKTTNQETMETITIPLGQLAPGEAAVSTPNKGMSKDMVLQSFGEPKVKRQAVGTPPISSWVFKDFTVYFESDFVIHSVLKHKMPEPQSHDTATPDTTTPDTATPKPAASETP